jgi:hypothetical protein
VDLGLASVMTRTNGAASGSASITIHGANMGAGAHTSSVMVGHTGCERTIWEADTSVRCQAGQSLRGSLRISMTSGLRSGSLSQGYSTDVGRLLRDRSSPHTCIWAQMD